MVTTGPTHLNDTLHAEAERLLTVAQIWKLGNFGWSNAYDADPDLIGHAQWQTDPPIDNPMNINARGTFKAAQLEPPEWLKTIAIAGADFEGLMEAARMSMGRLLLSIDAAKGNDFINQNFGNCGCLSKLAALVLEIVKMRTERNSLVHEIATEIAQHERQSYAQQSGWPPPTVENFQELQTMRAAIREGFAREREAAVKNLSDRYSLLVRVSNENFEFENHMRRRP